MILRQCLMILVLRLVFLITLTKAKNENYDANDWIPIAPTHTRKAEIDNKNERVERVLNVDSSTEKFLLTDDHSNRRPDFAQFLRQTVYLKENSPRPQKGKYQKEQYRYETVPLNPPPPPPPPREVVPRLQRPPSQQPRPQYYSNQEVQPYLLEPLKHRQNVPLVPQESQYVLQQHEISQPPLFLQQQVSNSAEPQVLQFAAPQGFPVLNPLNEYPHYNFQVNNSFYELLNPNAFNKDLLGDQNLESPEPPLQGTRTDTNLQREKDPVQLVYVPINSLSQAKPKTQNFQSDYREVSVANHVNSQNQILAKKPLTQQSNPNLKDHQAQEDRIQNTQNDLTRPRISSYNLKEQQLEQRLYITTTTPKPIKQKPHQPSLALYMVGGKNTNIMNVLEVLMSAKTIAVQDNVNEKAPQVFIGPSYMNLPNGYTKFPLPYLNNIEGNRIQRKIDHLPFFVAPLNYKLHPGYSKIVLPSPHVGTVVINRGMFEKQTTERSIRVTPNDIPRYELKGSKHVPFEHTTQRKIPSTNPYLDPQNVIRNNYIQNHYVKQHDTRQKIASSQDNLNLDRPVLKPQNFNHPNAKQITNVATEDTSKPLKPLNEAARVNLYSQEYEKQNLISQRSTTVRPDLSQNSPESRIQNYNLNSANVQQVKSIELVPRDEFQSGNTEVDSEKSTTLPNENVRNYVTQNSKNKPAINHYQLQQINHQFSEPIKEKGIVEIVKERYQEESNRPNNKNYLLHNRFISSNTPSTVYDSYEEFPVADKTPTSTLPTLSQVIQDGVAKNQYVTVNKYAAITSTTPSFKDEQTEIEHIPAKVYQFSAEPIGPIKTQSRLPVHQRTIVQNEEVSTQSLVDPQTHRNQELVPQKEESIESLLYNRKEAFIPQIDQAVPEKIQNQINYKIPLTVSQVDEIISDLITDLDDQSVKPLLVPKLLVPTTEQQITHSTPREEYITEIDNTKSVAEASEIESSTSPRQRSRGRTGGSRYTTPSTVTHIPRQDNRRKPTTEVPHDSNEYISEERYESARQNPINTRLRFRTRGRPDQDAVTELLSNVETSKMIENYNSDPASEEIYRQSQLVTEPQSYRQLEHTVENLEVVTIKPEVRDPYDLNQYQVHRTQATTPLKQTDNVGTENLPPRQKEQIDYQVSHPLRPTPQYHESDNNENNFYSTRNEYISSTTSRPTVRNRSRGRYRFALSSTTTEAPLRKHKKVEKLHELNYRTNQGSRIASSKSPHEETGTKLRQRVRVRTTTKKPQSNQYNQKSVSNEVNNVQDVDQVIRQSATNSRSRGRMRFSPPKGASRSRDDDDLEGENYPASFLKSRKAVAQTAPGSNLNEYDQSAYPSIYRPQYLQSTVSSSLSQLNYIPPQAKEILTTTTQESVTTPEISVIGDPSPASIETSDENLSVMEIPVFEINKTEGARIIPTMNISEVLVSVMEKEVVNDTITDTHKDEMETAESQNYHTIGNSFDITNNESKDISKVSAHPVKATEVSKEQSSNELSTVVPSQGSFLDKFYEIFHVKDDPNQTRKDNSTVTSIENVSPQSTTLNPAFLDEFTESIATDLSIELNKTLRSEMMDLGLTTNSPEASTLAPYLHSQDKEETNENFQVQPWEMKVVKIFTSTEVSHGAEMCYKGRCIKGSVRKNRT